MDGRASISKKMYPVSRFIKFVNMIRPAMLRLLYRTGYIGAMCPIEAHLSMGIGGDERDPLFAPVQFAIFLLDQLMCQIPFRGGQLFRLKFCL